MKRRYAWVFSWVAMLGMASIARGLDPWGPQLYVAVSPDGKQVAANMGGREDVCLFDAATGWQHRRLLTLDPRSVPDPFSQLGTVNAVHGLAYSASGRYIAAATVGEAIFVWDLRANEPPLRLKLDQWCRCESFVFSSDETSLIAFVQGSPNAHEFMARWDLKTAKETWRRDLGEHQVAHFALCPDGSAVVQDFTGGTRVESPPGINSDIKLQIEWRDVRFSRDGRLAILFSSAGAEVAETRTGRTVAKIDSDRSLVTASISPDGKLVAIGAVDGTPPDEKYRIDIYTVQSGKRLRQIPCTMPVTPLCFFPDSRRLIAGSGTGQMKILDSLTGQVMQTLGFPDPATGGGGGGGIFADPPPIPYGPPLPEPVIYGPNPEK